MTLSACCNANANGLSLKRGDDGTGKGVVGKKRERTRNGRCRNSVALPFRLVRFAGKQHAADRKTQTYARGAFSRAPEHARQPSLQPVDILISSR